jgi:Tol biopolymer transport system component
VLWSVNRRGETLAPRDVTRLLISIPAFARTPGTDVTIARDGSRIAYLALEQATDQLAVYVRNLDQLDAQQIPGSQLPKESTQAGTGATPFFSPDGKSIGFRTRDGIMRASLAEGPPSKILSDPQVFLGAEWGPDETLLILEVVSGSTGYRQLVEAFPSESLWTSLRERYMSSPERFLAQPPWF